MLTASDQEIAPAEPFGEAAEDITLPNRQHLRIRRLRDGEERPIRELLARVSPDSWYLRFLSPMLPQPDSLVALLAAVDNQRKAAFVAEHRVGDAVDVIALANFAAVDDHDVELGLLVRDDWQRRRVGTELAIRLMRAAERRGFTRFVIYALPENTAIRRLLKNVGVVVSSTFSGGISEIAFVPRPRDRRDIDME